jgi:hypothetical protein
MCNPNCSLLSHTSGHVPENCINCERYGLCTRTVLYVVRMARISCSINCGRLRNTTILLWIHTEMNRRKGKHSRQAAWHLALNNKNTQDMNVYIILECDMTVESLKSGARARRLLLSNGSEITFPLHRTTLQRTSRYQVTSAKEKISVITNRTTAELFNVVSSMRAARQL